MATYIVTLGRPGSGAGTFKIEIFASTPDEARRIAAGQYAGYVALAVRRQ